MSLKFDTGNLHKKLREITGNSGNTRKRIPLRVRNSNGELQLSEEDKRTTWEENIKDSFADNREEINEIAPTDDAGDNDRLILKSEMKYAIKN